MINTNKTIAVLLNFIFALIIISAGVYLLEVPKAETFFKMAQYVIGLIMVYIGFSFDLFKGE